ncbi:MAG: hypothetical protein MJ252_24765 [archaeon]|nr:hypothetical protein [archaeon]
MESNKEESIKPKDKSATINVDDEQHRKDAELNKKIEKFKSFFQLLENDLKKFVKNRQNLESEIKSLEEENQDYVRKLKKVLNFCEKKKDLTKNEKNLKIIQEIIKIITAIPEEFK